MFLGLFLATLIGLSLGLLGGGGSILMVPMLAYVLGQEPRVAIAGSLFVVGVTSLVGVVEHARAGKVVWRVGLLFGLGGMAGAFAGGRVAAFVPGSALLVAFAVMMLLTGVSMLRGRRDHASAPRELAPGRALALGASVGLVAGMLGAGGGFLIVPALVLFGGLAMPEAVATSLLVISLQALAGFAGHATHVPLDLSLLAVLAGASVAGALVGVRLAKRARPETLRFAFGWLVLAMGVFVLSREVPVASASRPVVTVLLAALGLAVGLAARASRPGRHAAGPLPRGA